MTLAFHGGVLVPLLMLVRWPCFCGSARLSDEVSNDFSRIDNSVSLYSAKEVVHSAPVEVCDAGNPDAPVQFQVVNFEPGPMGATVNVYTGQVERTSQPLAPWCWFVHTITQDGVTRPFTSHRMMLTVSSLKHYSVEFSNRLSTVQNCHSNGTWTDKHGYDCTKYQESGWCMGFGFHTHAFASQLCTTSAICDFEESDHLSARDACCGECGGGMVTALEMPADGNSGGFHGLSLNLDGMNVETLIPLGILAAVAFGGLCFCALRGRPGSSHDQGPGAGSEPSGWPQGRPTEWADFHQARNTDWTGGRTSDANAILSSLQAGELS